MSTPRRGTAKPPGKLRIIGGDFRRRMLPVLDHPGLRPTPDRVRETLFNWLGQALHGKQVLDLFAGTGALGFEALSRGAASVCFVENGRSGQRLIGENMRKLDAAADTQLLRHDATRLGPWTQAAFGLVFLDPPYGRDLVAPALETLLLGNWLAEGAVAVVRDDELPR